MMTLFSFIPGNLVQDFDPSNIQSGFVAFATKWATPLAVIGIILALLAFLVVPLLPEWAAGMKGYIVRALLIVAVITVVPSIVSMAAKITSPGNQVLLPLFTPVLAGCEGHYHRWAHWYRQRLGLAPAATRIEQE